MDALETEGPAGRESRQLTVPAGRYADSVTERTVLHIDMDAFYASVEQRDRPELRGQPVLVGHDGPRGVVAAASYEARKYGCRSAQPMSRAKRMCPHAIIVPGDMRRYAEASGRMFAILEESVPVVEPLSIDEAFLDLTGTARVLGDPVAFAERLRARIRAEIGLTASVGVAPNKFLAKLASDIDKPDGLTVVPRRGTSEWLAPLPIERLWGVGPKTAERLRKAGLHTFGDVAASDAARLVALAGSLGDRLNRLARGEDPRPVISDARAKSVGQECTFGEDLADPVEVRRVLDLHVDAVSRRLRKAGVRARTVTIRVRFGDFETVTRQTTLAAPADTTSALGAAARALFERWCSESFQPVRLIGFSAGDLRGGGGQLGLFDDPGTARDSRLDEAMDAIRDRHGASAIRRGAGPAPPRRLP